MAAAADGLFADHGLDVELLDPLRDADGRPDNIRRTADGDIDFCFTGVRHYLDARRTTSPLPARFVASVGQYSHVSAVVLADSDITSPHHLEGRTIGIEPHTPHGAEFMHALATRGVRPVWEAMPQETARARLRRGDIHAYVAYVDTLPGSRRLVSREVRSMSVGLPIYTSGLIAWDGVPDEIVAGMRAALIATFEGQRGRPRRGVKEMVSRYPKTRPEEAAEAWSRFEPLAFAGPVGDLSSMRWARTVDAAYGAHGETAPCGELPLRLVGHGPAPSAGARTVLARTAG